MTQHSLAWMDGASTTSSLVWSAQRAALYRPGSRFDPWRLQWLAEEDVPADAVSVASPQAALQLVASGAGLRRVPVGVIGPREATVDEYAMAQELGRLLAEHSMQLICGGKSGVMEGACKGHLLAGGLPVGLLPDTEWREGNPYVAIPIATGIGPARNALLARASIALVAIGGGYGTLTEMAYGLHFSRPVLSLGSAPFVSGAEQCPDPEAVVARLAAIILTGETVLSPSPSQ